MKKLMKSVLSYIVVLLLGCSVVLTVYASEIDATLQTVTGSAYLSDMCSQANASVDEEILSYESSSGLLRFKNKVYKGLDADDKEKFMETALSYIAKLPDTVSAKMRNSVYNFIAQQDTAVTAAMKYLQVNAGADLVEAEKWFAPFNSVVGTIMGILCILIFLFLGLSILLDIFYIVVPPFQALLDSGTDGTKRPWGVSREAWGSMRDAEKTDEYKNILGMYFKRRVGVLLIVAVAIMYMISGKIYDLVIWFVESMSL